ncbi:3-deoxy-manno-octulosonate cytidylyltransferase [Neisseria chenwenguii]|uniref:3-deoxy-manno-octulosonate cytidylyltransferase n=1 Tax=Neisseria chenwenguii TaxID=1853278 RepID=A0A220RZZ0_9NEIS|nr:3-deoxy-manno-octulosonate cytidylyltransferase [Neisseria chenwenguii]ASK26774.1 3-deoxy-manno-octulosonate cytidylyltransferase [Neisseria chenwenguii]ROV56437.1 3-deoxy-manno-octulosonate cytidylyltransferase [Neisseria chenwenguii]
MTDFSRLNPTEVRFLNEVKQLVDNDDQEVDYSLLKVNAPDEAGGEFWFRFAEILSTLPPNRSLDLRFNGRLAEAVSLLSVMIEDTGGRVPELWAQKTIALNFLAHGHATRACGLMQLPERSADAQEEDYLAQVFAQNLCKTLREAVARFPDDKWFADFQADVAEHFDKPQPN